MTQQLNPIKKLRLQKDLSLRQLALETNIGASTLNRLENGGKAYERTIFKLATYFGVAYEDLAEFVAVSPKENRQSPVATNTTLAV